jgi:hypothetical protein
MRGTWYQAVSREQIWNGQGAGKDYFVRSCIYNRVCVVGKREVIYRLVEELQNMQTNISEVVKQFEQQEVTLTSEGLEDMRNDCMDMLQAILWMLDGAKYLWQGG